MLPWIGVELGPANVVPPAPAAVDGVPVGEGALGELDPEPPVPFGCLKFNVGSVDGSASGVVGMPPLDGAFVVDDGAAPTFGVGGVAAGGVAVVPGLGAVLAGNDGGAVTVPVKLKKSMPGIAALGPLPVSAGLSNGEI